MRNVVIAQSGGPTAVINNSIRGVIDTLLKSREKIGRIYGARMGIVGVLQEDFVDITAQRTEQMSHQDHRNDFPGCH